VRHLNKPRRSLRIRESEAKTNLESLMESSLHDDTIGRVFLPLLANNGLDDVPFLVSTK
jgi:hypothetical protein